MTAAKQPVRFGGTVVRPMSSGPAVQGAPTYAWLRWTVALSLAAPWVVRAIERRYGRPSLMTFMAVFVGFVMTIVLVRWAWSRNRSSVGPRESHQAWEVDWPVRPRLFDEPPVEQFPDYAQWIGTALMLTVFWFGIAYGLGRPFPLVATGLVAAWVAIESWFLFRKHQVADARLAFERFPFRVGEPIGLRFGIGASGGQFEELRFTLYCLRSTHRPAPEGWICKQYYEQSLVVSDPDHLPGPGSDIDIRFEAPAEAPGTGLVRASAGSSWPTATQRIYWELQVDGRTSLGGWQRFFPIPVYAIPEREPLR